MIKLLKLKNFFNLEKSIISYNIIKYNSIEIIRNYEIILNLFSLYKNKKKIKIKLGIDTTFKDIHLGHLILFNKIKQIEKLDLKIIILIGNLTASIGDPTNRKLTRKFLNKKDILKNIKYFIFQIKNFIKIKKFKIFFNSEWLDHIILEDIKIFFINSNISKFLSKNNFKYRYMLNINISFYEFIYSLFQSYDSIFIKCNIEIGGLDQKLNFLITRFFQKKFKKNLQVIVLFNLLIGLDGIKKMSKSINNYISINENLYVFFVKILKLSNNLLKIYLKLLYLKKTDNIIFKKKNFIFYKKELYLNLIKVFYNKKVSFYFLNNFENKYNNIWPKKIKFYKLELRYIILYELLKKLIKIYNSTNKTISIIKQKNFKLNNCLIKNPNFIILKGKYILTKNKNIKFYIEIF